MSHDAVESSGVNESCGDSNEVMKEWNHDWLYFRQILDSWNDKASLRKYCANKLRFIKLQFFKLMIPKQYFIAVISYNE